MIPSVIAALDEYTECVILNRNEIDDGMGGYTTVWTPGAHFSAAIVLDDSIDMRVAESQGVKGNYSVAVTKNVRLPWHTVFRRIKDGATFRVTTRDDFIPPASSVIDLRSVTAEEWELPDD